MSFLCNYCLGTVLRVFKTDIIPAKATFVLAGLFAIHSFAGEEATSEKLIKITTERDGETTHFYVENLQAAEVTVTFETKLSNLELNEPVSLTKTYPGKQRVKAFSVHPKNRNESWSWGYTYYATYGSLTAVHDAAAVYALPFDLGKSFRVTQGYNGKYSHYGANQYAIDWKMPVGTPVHAARSGVVVGVKQDSNAGGADDKFDGDANYIMIQHHDGTIGHYVHLEKNGSRVVVGQKVEAGELIGFSGNTGHSTGPHLHFSVFKAGNGKDRVTIPVQFETGDGIASTLKAGRAYTAAGSLEFSSLMRSGTKTSVSAKEVLEAGSVESNASAGKP